MDELRERMVDAVSAELGVSRERASAAMHAAWEATKDHRGGAAPPSYQPDLADPGQALAHRVQAALEREFTGERLFPCVVVVQDGRSGRVGVAATAVTLAEQLVRLGAGTLRRQARQFGEP